MFVQRLECLFPAQATKHLSGDSEDEDMSIQFQSMPSRKVWLTFEKSNPRYIHQMITPPMANGRRMFVAFLIIVFVSNLC